MRLIYFLPCFGLFASLLAEPTPAPEETSSETFPQEMEISSLPEKAQDLLIESGYSGNTIDTLLLVKMVQEAQLKKLDLHPREGKIELRTGLAYLDLSKEYLYYGPEDAQKILTDLWGNPKGEPVLGMIMPKDKSALDPDGWAIIIQYEEEGHIDDADARSIDYDGLLAEIKKAEKEANVERVKEGYPEIHLVGWAERPYYDEHEKKMYWAKEIHFEGREENTLNYNIRILGRKGVLILNTVAGISQLEAIRPEMTRVLSMTNFSEEHSYENFNPDTDTLAAYGIGALVAGKVAAKVGFLAKFGAILLGLKKFIFVIIFGALGFIKKIFGRKKDSV